MATCRAYRTGNRIRCGRTATHHVVAGCVHEHITETTACQEHAQNLVDGQVNCVVCFDADEWHLCKLLGRLHPIEQEVAP